MQNTTNLNLTKYDSYDDDQVPFADYVDGMSENMQKIDTGFGNLSKKVTDLPGQISTSGNAATATRLQNTRTIDISGAVTGTATAFDGTKDITIPVTAVDASKLTGTASIPTTGNASTATKLQTSRTIDISGAVTGTATAFDGTKDITIPVTAVDASKLTGTASVPTTGNATTATRLQTARRINGISFNGTSDIVNYGVCSTNATTAAKVVACAGFALVTGASIDVKFTISNTAQNPTLNVNNTGARNIYYRGKAVEADKLVQNGIYTFRYDGSHYELVGGVGSGAGIVVSSSTPTTLSTGDFWFVLS